MSLYHHHQGKIYHEKTSLQQLSSLECPESLRYLNKRFLISISHNEILFIIIKIQIHIFFILFDQ